MALVTIKGTLTDFGLDALTNLQPRLLFIASGAAFKNEKVLSSRDIEVIPDSAGKFTVQLESTENVVPYQTFTVRIEWLEPGGYSGGGYVGLDLIEKFQVPPQSGDIGTIAALTYDPTSVWVAPTPPSAPAISTWWLDTTTGDLYEWMWTA